MATSGQFYWPPVGNSVATYGQFDMAANIGFDRAGVLHRIDTTVLASR